MPQLEFGNLMALPRMRWPCNAHLYRRRRLNAGGGGGGVHILKPNGTSAKAVGGYLADCHSSGLVGGVVQGHQRLGHGPWRCRTQAVLDRQQSQENTESKLGRERH